MTTVLRLVVVVWVALVAISCISATPLDDYVNRPDPNYKWELVSKIEKPEFTTYMLNLTSQQWLTAADSSRPIWTHWLEIVVPKKIELHGIGFVYINGGGNRENPPTDTDLMSQLVATQIKGIVVSVDQIPNERISFPGDPLHKDRTEDAIIAYTWKHYIDHPDQPDWLLRLPMTKAVVRAMDALSEFSATLPGVQKIEKFAVAGASKRGWTTWTVAAVDKRVIAMIPIVMDAANLVNNVQHMYRAYGCFSFAWEDYYQENITRYIQDKSFEAIGAVIDPYVYFDRYTNIPKLIVDATGDEFFLPDDANYWWSDLQGEKHLRMIADAEHSLTGHQIDAAMSIATFVRSVALNVPRPSYNWTRDADSGRIVLWTESPPKQVIMWHANNPKGRDFRLVVCGKLSPECLNPIIWTYKTLTRNADGTYVAEMPMPMSGFTAFFIEVIYDTQLGLPGEHLLKFTTQVSIIPNVLPFPNCGNPCNGILCPGAV